MENYARPIADLITRLSYRMPRAKVWTDAMTMIACAISNVVDGSYRAEREALYLHTAQTYRDREMALISELFGTIVCALEANPNQDLLGQTYMQLEIGNKYGGQFFTPYQICALTAALGADKAQITAEIKRQGFYTVTDPACGAGGMLIASAHQLRALGLDYQRDALYIGQDIDSTTAMMCYIQLSMLGCAGYVLIGDTLREPQTAAALYGEPSPRCWFTPAYFTTEWTARRACRRAEVLLRRRHD